MDNKGFNIDDAISTEEKVQVGVSDPNNNVISGKSDSDSSCESDDNLKAERHRIYKNVLLISLAFFFNFNAFSGLSRLQSSMHEIDGLGIKANAVIYISLIISCMFLPTIIIRTIGHRWTIVISFIGFIIYIAANGYAVWATMMPAAVLVGLSSAPLWTAQASYFTIIGSRYARLFKEREDLIVAKFFGIFFMFFQISNLTGAIISSTALKPKLVNPNDTVEIDLQYCGKNDCPWNNVTNPNLEAPSDSQVWLLVGIYIIVALLALLTVAIFVDNLKPEDVVHSDHSLLSEVVGNFLATFKHWRHKEMLLLIPITMYSGFEEAFYSAEFSKSFVTCSLGIWKIGLVVLPYGIVNSIVSFSGSYACKYIGRISVFTIGLFIDLCIQITLMIWIPAPGQEYVLYILSTMWGITDGIWQTQINTFYGIIFSKESEAAFSNHRMWEGVGFIVAYSYSDYICTSVKLYVLTGFLIAGMTGYYTIEFLKRRELKQENKSDPEVTFNDITKL